MAINRGAALPGVRTTWRIPGDTGKEVPAVAGKPAPTPDAVQMHYVKYENGEEVGFRQDPETKDWIEVDAIVIDDTKAKTFAAAEAKRNAPPERIPAPASERFIVNADGSQRENPNYVPPGQASTKTPDEARLTAAQATTAEAAARAATAGPSKITRPLDKPRVIGPEGQEAVTETVTQDQADYDLKRDQERRVQQQALITQAQQAEQTTLQRARDAVAAGTLSAQLARDKVNEELDRIRIDLDRSSQALTRRGQDVSMRNTDLNAGVSQRNTDIDFSQGLAQNSTSLAVASLPYLNAPGQVASTNSLMRGGPPVATQPMQNPFDPLTFPSQAAMQARSALPPQVAPGAFTLPGAPPPQLPQPGLLPPQQFRLGG